MLSFYPYPDSPLALTAPLFLEPCEAGFPSLVTCSPFLDKQPES